MFWVGVALCYLAIPAPFVVTVLTWDAVADRIPLWWFGLEFGVPAGLLIVGLALMRLDELLDEV